MITEDYIRKVLATLEYGDNEILKLDIEGADEKAYAIEIKGKESLDLWAEFRTLFDETGMWPVAHACWGNPTSTWKEAVLGEEIFMRRPFSWEPGSENKDVSPSQIISRSKDCSSAEMIKNYDSIYSEDLFETIEYELEKTKNAFGSSPPLEDAHEVAEKEKSIVAYEKWLLSWELDNYPDINSDSESCHISWFEPEGQRQSLLLVPANQSSDVLAYIHWYGAESIGSEVAISQLREWGEKYGAELVAHYGTMLQLNVANSPNDLQEAFALATEQVALAPCTLALPGVSIREHARCLLDVRQWFLHERP